MRKQTEVQRLQLEEIRGQEETCQNSCEEHLRRAHQPLRKCTRRLYATYTLLYPFGKEPNQKKYLSAMVQLLE